MIMFVSWQYESQTLTLFRSKFQEHGRKNERSVSFLVVHGLCFEHRISVQEHRSCHAFWSFLQKNSDRRFLRWQLWLGEFLAQQKILMESYGNYVNSRLWEKPFILALYSFSITSNQIKSNHGINCEFKLWRVSKTDAVLTYRFTCGYISTKWQSNQQLSSLFGEAVLHLSTGG